jgi:YHS domain-containing protein
MKEPEPFGEHFGLKDYSDGTATQSVDPVCGRIVDESDAAGKVEYAGQVYYFCSRECKTDFQDHPGTFIGQRH